MQKNIFKFNLGGKHYVTRTEFAGQPSELPMSISLRQYREIPYLDNERVLNIAFGFGNDLIIKVDTLKAGTNLRRVHCSGGGSYGWIIDNQTHNVPSRNQVLRFLQKHYPEHSGRMFNYQY